jgi:hypothetical protein
MNRDQAKRLIQKCLPALKASGNDTENLENQLSSDGDVKNKIKVRNICRLWGGMGYVYSLSLADNTIVVKRVSPLSPNKRKSLSDRRKADSYEVEANFYENLANYLLQERGLDIPQPLHVERDDGITICMSKVHGCVRGIDEDETRVVLQWLATLHAASWGIKADEAVEEYGLQPIGTYWHLDTRPDEYSSIRNSGWEGRLKRAARAIDERLKRDKMQCCVHGDAKDANMLFYFKDSIQRKDNLRVSMYDFQYCGKGPPTKDLAYFFCVAAHDNSSDYVVYYHNELLKRLESGAYRPTLEELNDSLQLSYCDWARFMAGWGFWGIDISDKVILVLDRLDGGVNLGTENAYDEAIRREYG